MSGVTEPHVHEIGGQISVTFKPKFMRETGAKKITVNACRNCSAVFIGTTLASGKGSGWFVPEECGQQP